MTTFSPLTLSGEGFFYYIRFPDKKGVSSVIGGETNVVSVLSPFNEGTDMLFTPPNEVNILRPFVVKTTHSGRKWENYGLSNYGPKVLSYESISSPTLYG